MNVQAQGRYLAARPNPWRAVLVMLALFVGSIPTAHAQTQDVLVFAAASLKDALDDIAGQYRKETGKAVRISYRSSAALSKQIDAGAPADIFISADLDWIDSVAQRHLCAPGPRTNIL